MKIAILAVFLVLCTGAFAQSQNVSVALYYESLCPYCQQFVKGSLNSAMVAPGVADIIDLTLVPYGNAKETQSGSTWEFTCQHGADECVGNLIETCVLGLYPKREIWWPFIHCVESSSSDMTTAGKQCAATVSGVSWSAVQSCVGGAQGNTWEHAMATKTAALTPAHQYVPWIVINGIHTEKIQDEATNDLLSLVCKLYQGTPPVGCHAALGMKHRSYIN